MFWQRHGTAVNLWFDNFTKWIKGVTGIYHLKKSQEQKRGLLAVRKEKLILKIALISLFAILHGTELLPFFELFLSLECLCYNAEGIGDLICCFFRCCGVRNRNREL